MIRLAIILVLMSLMGAVAFADDDQSDNKVSGYAMPMIGLTYPVSNAQGGPYFTLAGEAGIHFLAGYLGIFADTIGNSATYNGAAASATVTALMLSFTAQVGVIYFGGRFGLGFRTLSETTSSGASYSASGSSFAVAPVIGARIPVANNVSFNFETSWLTISPGSVSGTLGSANLTSAGYLVPLVGAQINF